MNSTFDPSHFWSQGDGFSHFITIAIVIMSILSWGVIFLRLSMYRHLRSIPRALTAFWHSQGSNMQITALATLDKKNLLTSIALLSLQPIDTATLERKMALAVRQANQHLNQGLTLLATIASGAPFVGLLGTVWGIYRTLTNIATQGQIETSNIIGHVGEALIMTAAGLAVALPSLFAYNFFSRNNQIHQDEIDAFSHDLLNSRSNNQ